METPSRRIARREALLAAAATLALLGLAFIGRAVISADDGAQMMADTLGFVVQGRFESATIPPERIEPHVPPAPAFHSPYGVVPSVVPLPFVAAGWALRGTIGAAGADAIASLTWMAGALLAALAFFRLARALKPDASPLWVPAFLGGTYLFTYVADSYMESWAAAGIALAGSRALRESEHPPWRAALGVAAPGVFAFLLRPFDWIVAPGLALAAFLAFRKRPDGGRRGAWLLAWLVAGLALHGLLNLSRHGSATDFGYGYQGALPFINSLGAGLVGSLVHPGRGLLWYAPVVVAALVGARRLGGAARVLCLATPLVVIVVAARWYGWHGGSCWGPRYLVPVLPLLAAPAVLAPRRLAAPLVLFGLLLNLPGVLVASGAWQYYAESLVPPPGAAWPKAGGERVSEKAVLAPLLGHSWLLANAVSRSPLPAPWLSRGARETAPPPPPGAFVSPWVVRRVAGLPPIPPFLPRLLVRAAAGYVVRGRPEEGARFARAALSLDPGERDAPRVLEAAGAMPRRCGRARARRTFFIIPPRVRAAPHRGRRPLGARRRHPPRPRGAGGRGAREERHRGGALHR